MTKSSQNWSHQEIGHWKPENGVQKLQNGDRTPEDGHWNPENGDQKLENGGWEPENGDRKLVSEAGNAMEARAPGREQRSPPVPGGPLGQYINRLAWTCQLN